MLNDNVRKLIDGRNFAIVATTNADGSPQSSVVWITRDSDDLLFATVRGRRKERNLRRDPRVSVTVLDDANGYDYAEIRGTATLTEQGGRQLINELSHKYQGTDFHDEPAEVVRVVVRISPSHVVG
ncbi:MAG TPA: PPOX class F420-dependent oxidoreductase [Pseudonocardiaceae bacterium]|nr:PPOX class F420-dependent oxidoreductase [Pseudonocardiaceae bacterium]